MAGGKALSGHLIPLFTLALLPTIPCCCSETRTRDLLGLELSHEPGQSGPQTPHKALALANNVIRGAMMSSTLGVGTAVGF